MGSVPVSKASSSSRMTRYAVPQISPSSPLSRLASASRVLATLIAISALVLGSCGSNADVTIPKADPPFSVLSEPAQTQSPAVY